MHGLLTRSCKLVEERTYSAPTLIPGRLCVSPFDTCVCVVALFAPYHVHCARYLIDARSHSKDCLALALSLLLFYCCNMSSPTKNRALKTLRRLPPNQDTAKAAPLKVAPASPSGLCAAPTPPPSPFDNPRYLMRNLPPPPTPPRTSSTPPVSPTKSKWSLKKVVKPPPSLPSRPSSRAAPQEAVPEPPPPSPTVTQVENVMNVVATALGGVGLEQD